VKAHLGTPDYSSFLLQAQSSGAKILAINVAGDSATAIKQAEEFGLADQGMKIVPMSFQNVDIHAVALKATRGDLILTSFFEDVSPAARRFSDAFYARRNAMPSQIQAGVYSAVRHYLHAIKDADSNDSATVVARMKATPVSVPTRRTAGFVKRMVHDLYLVQIKTPAESMGPWDFVKLVATIPPDEAFRPLDRSKCSLVGK
jgi:branched-chain amino acid transport system substrate-binding protein